MNNYLSRPRPALLGMALLLILSASSWAASPTAFSYQGRLAEEGQPANGIYDFRFVIRDALIDGNQLRGTQTKLAVPVRDGVFTVAIDFGSSVFDGEVRWLDIGTRTNGGSTFTSLTPLQPIRPTPIAIAANVLNGTVAASQVTGSLGSAALAGLYENPLRFNSPSNRFTGDGSNLRFGGFSFTNLPFYWNTKGNAGTTPGLHFVGTLDAQPLELRVNNQRVLRLEPTSVSPNLIGGFGANYADAGTIGSTIGGGGTLEAPNRIIKDSRHQDPQPPEFATIGGGSGNTISGASYVTIGGGANNYVSQNMWYLSTPPKFHSVIAGGANNALVSAFSSTISGGTFNRMTGDPGQLPIGGTIGGGTDNSVSTITYNVNQPTIAGGYGNGIVQADFASIGGGRQNRINNDARQATIGGGGENLIGAVGENATISGGFSNRISPQVPGGTIGGGAANLIQNRARYATIAGGLANGIGEEATGAVISGGESNRVNGLNGTVSGGAGNLIQPNTFNATIGGGSGNQIAAFEFAEAFNGTIGGGSSNRIDENASHATIGGGTANNVGALSYGAIISGGVSNRMYRQDHGAVIGGGVNNFMDLEANYAVIAGGLSNTLGWYNRGSTIGGGIQNRVGSDAQSITISGGAGNLAGARDSSGVTIGGGLGNAVGPRAGTIAGGSSNSIGYFSSSATIGGGSANRINLYAGGATIGGGTRNNIGDGSWNAVISGGESNQANGPYSTVVGGQLNVADGDNALAGGFRVRASGLNAVAFGIATEASGPGSTAMGVTSKATGDQSTAFGHSRASGELSTSFGHGAHASGYIATAMGQDTVASGFCSTAFGWEAVASGPQSTAMGWTTTASGGRSTAMGWQTSASGQQSVAMGWRTAAMGANSLAAGYRAQATNDGTFVWADSQDADFTSTGTNQFLIRASGGVGIGTESPQFALHVNGDAGKPGGGAWSVASDARLKKDIRPLEQALARLLQLHGVTYEYKNPGAIHELAGQQTGMIAQEVEKVFPEWVESGRDGMKRLSVRGFEALAVEALRELRAEKDAQIRSMEKRLAAIEAKLAGDDGK